MVRAKLTEDQKEKAKKNKKLEQNNLVQLEEVGKV